MQRYTYSFLILLLLSKIAFAEMVFDRQLSLGGQFTAGNTETNSLNVAFSLNRNNRFVDELTIKGSFDQQANSGAETRFKVYSLLRYARSLSKKTYYYSKLEAEHDRFQDIDLRLLPTIGLGYWFADKSMFNAMVEGALGYQRQTLLNNEVEETAIVALTSKLLWGSLTNSLALYGSASDLSNFRVSEALDFKVKLNDHYAVKWTLKDEYNSKPPANIKKNDLSFITAIEYSSQAKI